MDGARSVGCGGGGDGRWTRSAVPSSVVWRRAFAPSGGPRNEVGGAKKGRNPKGRPVGGKGNSRKDNGWQWSKGARCVVRAPSPYGCSAPRKNVDVDRHWARRRIPEVERRMPVVSLWRSMIRSVLERGASAGGRLLMERGGYGRSGVEAAQRTNSFTYGVVERT